MSQTLPSYSDYKPAGLPWLDRVPSHWEITRLKNWVTINSDVLPENTVDDFAFHYLDIGCVGNGHLLKQPEIIKFGQAPSRARRVVKVGDTLLSTVRTYLKAIYFFDNEAEEQNIVASTGFAVLTPNTGTLPKFLSYIIQNQYFIEQVTSASTGIAYPAISETVLGTFKVSYPSSAREQQSIVTFLDAKGRQIARLLRHKRQLIKLLTEQKQNIIHQAVTQGVDANVSRKDSGVDWLGDVPAHWEVKRIKYLLREVDSRSTTGTEPLLSMRMHHGLVPYNDHFERPQESTNLVNYKIVRVGQLVINRMQAGNGLIFFSSLEGLVSPDYAVFDVICDSNRVFLEELFRNHATRKKFRAESKGLGTGTSGFLRLYSDRLGAIHLALPPRSEQDFIVVQLDAQLVKINQAIARAKREIELIQEYRTRLIADVVTGRVDVRHLADTASGPELPAEDELDLEEEESEEELLIETEDGRE